jgi:hypothetical protein
MPHRLLLGPQRPVLNLGEVVATAPLPEGPIAVISAGWQEAEGDIDDIRELIDRPLIDLELYHRAEQVFAEDEALRDAYRQRQDRLQEQQRLYRLRLEQSMLAARQVRRAAAAKDLIAAEERHAISQLRALDRHHLRRVDILHAEFEDTIRGSHQRIEHVAAIEEKLADCATVLITGGNVLVLLNRLQLFDMRKRLAERHLVAWSAGAMVLSDRVVLFHDKTPLGRRDPELLGAGLGVLPGYIFLPDARRRLRQKDAVRTRLFNGRFAPARCVTLNSGALLHFGDGRVQRAVDVGYLNTNGKISELAAS